MHDVFIGVAEFEIAMVLKYGNYYRHLFARWGLSVKEGLYSVFQVQWCFSREHLIQGEKKSLKCVFDILHRSVGLIRF